jgi:glyoxylase-like metal-dependent hydrolase (beta-lactamase superfamily II)
MSAEASPVPSPAVSHVRPAAVGRIEVSVICEGFAPLPLADECPGQHPDWGVERRRFPWAFTGTEAWAWHVHAFLVRTPTATVLVDAGVGAFGPWRPWAESHADAWETVDARAIDHVILTHLHADHAGGTVRDGAPRFSNAAYHVHPGDWAAFEGVDDYVARDAMTGLDASGALNLQALDHEVVDGVAVIHTPGHTPGHRSVLIHNGDEALLITGDLLHLPIQIAHPVWVSDHDMDGLLGVASRRLLLWQARRDRWTVAVSHFASPFGTVGPDGWWDLPRAAELE